MSTAPLALHPRRRPGALDHIAALMRASKALVEADLSAPDVQLALATLGRDRHLMRMLQLSRLAHHAQLQRYAAITDSEPAASAAFAEANNL